MADGTIKIDISVDGKQLKIASKELDKLEQSGKKSGKGLGEAERIMINLGIKSAKTSKDVKGASDSLDKVNTNSKKASVGIKEIAVSLGLVAVASAAFNVLKSSLDGAIKRFDTLKGYPVIMERMGFSSEQAEASINKLSDGIQGLPTTLDAIVASAQNIAILTGDLDNATDTALALNNAFLASGSSAADAERGLVQYVQMLSKGEVDMQSWRTLQETMGYAINETAHAFGFAGQAAQAEFYEALKYGAVSFEEFNDKLIELNEGVGGFAEMASTGSTGIATSFGNLRNAVVVGAANMIGSFDKLSVAVTGKDIAQNLDSMKAAVSFTFKAINKTIEGTAPYITMFSDGIKATVPIVNSLTPAIVGLTASYVTYTAIMKTKAALDAAQATLDTITQGGLKTITLLTQAQIVAQMEATGATRADIVARTAQVTTIKLSTAIMGVMNGTIALSTVAQLAASKAAYALGAAWRFLTGPLGWVIAGVGLLVTGVVALVKWFKRSTAEGEKMAKKTDELADSTDSLNSSVAETSKSYDKNQRKIETNAEAYEKLAQKAEQLASRDKLSAKEKETLNSYIEELNKNVSGLNLVYGEESKALSASSEQIQNRIDLMKEEEKLQTAQERLTEIIKEQIDIEKQLEDINALREEWNQKLEDGSVKGREHKKALKELEEQELSLSEANKLAAEEQLKIDQQIIESSEAVAAAAEKDTGRQLLMLDELSEAQQKTVENMKDTWESYKDSATNMFDTLSEKSEISVSEMTKNLEENQRVITNWSENIAKLAERGVDEGLLNTLRDAGPESAGHVNALVKASDKELEKLSKAFSEGGSVATEALSKSLGIEDSGILESVGHLVMNTEVALRESITGANFESIGGDVAQGLADGIDSGSNEPAKASGKMADETTKAAKKALDSHSPSRVFKQIGTDVTDGLALGISDGTNKVQQAIVKMLQAVMQDSKTNFDNITKNHDEAVKKIEESMKKLPKIAQQFMKSMLVELQNGKNSQIQVMNTLASSLVLPFRNTNSQFRLIGTNSMAGLNAGLSAGAGQVMTTARRIANNVAATMRSALRIHSPSRLFRDDIGKMIPAGIAVGIEDNAKLVYRALNSVSDGMITATPEIALGTFNRATAGVFGNTTSNVMNTSNNHTDIKMDGLFNGATFTVREENDIKKLAKELNDYIKESARSRGVVMR